MPPRPRPALIIALHVLLSFSSTGARSLVPDQVSTASVSSGRELAAAIAAAVAGGPDVIQVEAKEVNLTADDWAGIPLPLVLPAGRNLTIRGSLDLPSGLPVLRMPTPPALTLLDNSTLILESLVMESFSKGTLMRGTTLNLLTPSPEGTRGAVVLSRHRPALFGMCLPSDLWAKQMLAAPRPEDVAGSQAVSTRDGSQDSCVNDTSAPPLKRCWAAVYTAVDVAFGAAGLDAASNPVPARYSIHLRGCDFLCTLILERSCVDSLGPLGCLLLESSRKGLPAQPSGPPGHNAVGTPGPGARWAAEGDGGGSPSAPVLVGCVVASAVVLALAVTATALVILRVRRRREGKAPPSSAGSTRGSSDPSLCPTDDTAPPPPQPGAAGATAPCAPQPVVGEDSAPSKASAPGEAEVVISIRTPLHNLSVDVKVLDAAVADSAAEGTGGIGADGPSASSPRAPAEIAIHKAPDNVVRLTGVVLGKGSFGRVLEGTYRGRTVAVKKLLGGMWCSPGSGQMLLQEIDVLGRCDHPNVVKLLAACVVATSEPVLVLERMDTSLDKMLYGSPGTLLPLRLVLHIAIQIAQGLSYLHPTILHRDLKPANVLVSDPQGEAPLVKLSDFGLSRLRESVLVTVQPEAGTPPYVAPECFDTNCEAITHLADCYSFGVLLWEMLAGARPWGGLSAIQVAYAVTVTSQRLPLPAHDTPGRDLSRWPPRLRRLLWQCWEADPRRRPAAAEIVKALILTQEDLKRGNT